jgi:predicted permease
MSARMGLMEGDYPTPEAKRLFYDRLLRELRSSPQFESAALTSRFRMVFAGAAPIEIEGKIYQTRRDRPNTNFEQAAGTIFDVTGQKVLEGRTFSDDDLDSKQPVAIVNAAFAKKHFGSRSAIGRRFRTGDGSTGPYGSWRTIVGVVSNVRMMGPFNNPNVDDSGFYVPFYATPVGPPQDTPAASQFATVVVRPHAGQQAESLIGALRREVAKIDPNLPLYFVGTPRQNLAGFVGANRIVAAMFTLFGVVAIVLAAAGIYGVMSFSVNQRRQEFGVRMALGAANTRSLGMILRQGSRQVLIGLATGVVLALTIAALGRDAIGSMLFGVSALDPLTYVAVTALIACVSLAAVLIPARRATRVDPMLALRAE